jgi:hypothetical protein
VQYGECESGQWNTGSVKAGGQIRGVRKRELEYGKCESGEWNTGSVKAGSGIRGD